MNKIILLLSLTTLLFSSNAYSQSMIVPGAFSGHAVKIKGMHTNFNQNNVVFGLFRDSVDTDPRLANANTVYGGSVLVHNSFLSVLDNAGIPMYSLGLGNTTDSVTIANAFLTDGDYVVVVGGFSGTVEFNPLGSSTVHSSVSPRDGFMACYTSSGDLFFFNQFSPSAGSNIYITSVSQETSNSSFYVAGYFDGNIDVDPSVGGIVPLSTTGGFDGFLLHLNSMGNYMEHGQLEGSGDAMPTEIHAGSFFETYVGVTFTGIMDTDPLTGTNNITSAGGKDVFYAIYDMGFFTTGEELHLGGSGNDVLKDLFIDFSNNEALFLIDYQGSLNLNPAGSAIVTSAGGTDVAYAKFALSGSAFNCGGSLGNSGNNEGSIISGKMLSGGFKSMSTAGFALTMNFSGTMDFDPDPTNEVFDVSTNTPVNGAIVNLDSIGRLIYHGTVEGSDIKGYYIDGSTTSNNVTIVGNYNGTDVDILPYQNVHDLAGSSDGGFFSQYNRCHMTSTDGPKLIGAYECETSTAQMKCDLDYGHAQPLSYFWSNGDYIDYNYIATGAGADPNYYYLNITDGFGCHYNDSIKIIGHIDYTGGFELIASAVITPTVCGENYGSAIAMYNNAVLPVSYYWSNGDTTSTADSLISGNYFLHVTDSLGCYYEAEFTIYNSDGPAITLTDLQNPLCHAASDGLIDITISGGTPPYSIEWTNGATSEDLNSLPAGTYTVLVTDAGGCTNIVCYNLAQPDFFGVSLQSSVNSDCGLSTGVLDVDAYGGLAPYIYQWSASASSFVGDSAYNIPAGIHTVVVTDQNGCTATGTYGLDDNTAPFSYVFNSANPVCTIGNGFIDVETFGTSPFTYQWAGGELTQDLTNVSDGGLYYLVTTDGLGCKDFLEVYLSETVPSTPPVCLVGVDSMGTHNVVVWDESITPEADYYKIYREGFCNSEDFGVVGIVQHEDLSVFYDTVVNTDTRTWRYYVTAVDTCGNESYDGAPHRTVHLSAVLDANNDAFLQWGAYEGRVISQYKIFRLQPSGTAYTLIDSVDAFTLEYLDTTSFSGYDSLLYYVEAVPQDICLAAKAYNQNASRSNTARMMTPLDTTGSSINTIVLDDKLIKLFPNPASNLVTLQVNGIETNWNMIMYDAYGRIRKQYTILQNQITLGTSDLSPGVYIIQLNSADGKFKSNKRLIITR